jgi:hypothetical protein
MWVVTNGRVRGEYRRSKNERSPTAQGIWGYAVSALIGTESLRADWRPLEGEPDPASLLRIWHDEFVAAQEDRSGLPILAGTASNPPDMPNEGTVCTEGADARLLAIRIEHKDASSGSDRDSGDASEEDLVIGSWNLDDETKVVRRYAGRLSGQRLRRGRQGEQNEEKPE